MLTTHPTGCSCPECVLLAREAAPRPPKLTGKRAYGLRRALAKARAEAEALAAADREDEQFREYSYWYIACSCWFCEWAQNERLGMDAYCTTTRMRYYDYAAGRMD